MNQSTTPLGSKRQSQGKHPYPTINIFICCCVSIVCPVNIYFYVFYFSVIFFFVLRRFIFYFYFFMFMFELFIFTKMVFLLAAILAVLSLFEVFVMLKFTVCPLPLEGIH